MNTNTQRAVSSAYTISKIGLLSGTAFEAWTQWSNLFGNPIFVAIFTGLTCLLFDRTAFRFLEEFAGHVCKQNTLPRGAAILSLVVGVLAFAGTMGFSVMSVPIIADAVTEDKSDTYKNLDDIKTRQDAQKSSLIAEATKEVERSEANLREAKEKANNATQDAINREGGEFASLMKAGNTWVHSAPVFAPQRSRVRQAQQAAERDIASANKAYQDAVAAKQQILLSQDSDGSAVIQAGVVSMQTWAERRKMMYSVTLFLTIGAGIISILSLCVFAAYRQIPDDKDISDVIGDFYDNSLAMIVAVLDMGNKHFAGAVEKIKRPKSVDPAKVKMLREYRRRDEAGKLGEKGKATLNQLEFELA